MVYRERQRAYIDPALLPRHYRARRQSIHRDRITQQPSILKELSKRLGGPKTIGTKIRSDADLSAAVRDRLPLNVIDHLVVLKFTRQEIDHIVPARTRRHRKATRRKLSIDESDRIVRLVRILTLAERTFGDTEKANRWLRRRLAVLDDQTPLETAFTGAGARLVESILAKIAWRAAA